MASKAKKGKARKESPKKSDTENDIRSYSDSFEIPSDIPGNVTQVSDLILSKKEQEVFSYVDEAKKQHKHIVTMINYITKDKLKNDCNCFWDRHPFDWEPLGIPISYVSKKITKEYYSEISKDKYTISESVTDTSLIDENDERYTTQPMDYYETDGVVCSFNCMLAFYEDSKKNPLYKHTYILMAQIYKKLFDEDIKKIYPAASWRLLKSYGGWMDIDEYRKTFNRVMYTDTGNCLRNIPKFRPIGWVYEEKTKF